jgi:hypothetical protein
MMAFNNSYNHTQLTHWESFTRKIQTKNKDVCINGRSLDLASVIAVARLVNLFTSYNSLGLLFSRHCSSIRIDETVVQPMEKSAKVVQDSLEKGETIYG